MQIFVAGAKTWKLLSLCFDWSFHSVGNLSSTLLPSHPTQIFAKVLVVRLTPPIGGASERGWPKKSFINIFEIGGVFASISCLDFELLKGVWKRWIAQNPEWRKSIFGCVTHAAPWGQGNGGRWCFIPLFSIVKKKRKEHYETVTHFSMWPP